MGVWPPDETAGPPGPPGPEGPEGPPGPSPELMGSRNFNVTMDNTSVISSPAIIIDEESDWLFVSAQTGAGVQFESYVIINTSELLGKNEADSGQDFTSSAHRAKYIDFLVGFAGTAIRYAGIGWKTVGSDKVIVFAANHVGFDAMPLTIYKI